MLTILATPGFAPQLKLRPTAPELRRTSHPSLQDIATADETPGFHFESDSDDTSGDKSAATPATEPFKLDDPQVAQELVETLISGGAQPGQALADVILATQLEHPTDEPLPSPDFFFEEEASATTAPLVAPIDPLTGELPDGVELPTFQIAVPPHDLVTPIEIPLPLERSSDGGSSSSSDGGSSSSDSGGGSGSSHHHHHHHQQQQLHGSIIGDEVALAAAAAAASSETAIGAPPELPTLKELALFCLPTLGIWLSSPLLSLIDTSVVGLTSATYHLAALAPSTKLCDYVAFFCSVIGAATTNLAADAFARSDPTKAKRVIGSSLSISVMLGASVALALGLSARALMSAMLGSAALANPAMLTAATQYTTIRALGYPAALLTMVLQSAFISTKDSKSPLLAVPLAAIVNLFADLALVPSMGAAGAAWATTLALYTNAVTLLAMWARKARTIASQPVRVLTVPNGQEFKALLAFAAPMTVALMARVSMGLSITLSAVTLGTTALAANQIIESLYWLFCPFGEAIALCMQAYLPPLLLHGRSLARRLQAQALRAGAGMGALAAALAVVLPVGLPGLFTSSSAVVGSMASAAPMLGFTLFSYVLFCATEGMLIARKQLRFLAISHVSNALLFAAALRAVISRPMCGLQHVWAIFGCMNLLRLGGFTMGLRLEDRAHLVQRKEDPMSLGRDSPRWQRALRALSERVDALRHVRREKIHQLVPPVEQIAPHLLGPEPTAPDHAEQGTQ